MNAPELTMRQLVEGMALGFDEAAAGPLRAVLEFAFTGEDSGTYQLIVEGGACRFAAAPVAAPSLRIETDAEVWRAVSEGRLQPMAAVMDGRLGVAGDLGLFQSFPRLFRRVSREDLRVPPGHRAPGSFRLPAMAWLFVDLLPWKLFWVLLAFQGAQRALLVALVVAGIILAVREISGGATFLERATTAVFAGATVPVALGAAAPPELLGASFLALGGIWAATLVHAAHPLTAEYSRWNYVPRLWSTGLFRHPNALLTLLWACIFAAFAILSAAGARGWIPQWLSTATSISISAAAGMYTRRYEGSARDRRIDHLDASLARLRVAARVLLGVIAAGFLLLGDPPGLYGWVLVPAAVLVVAATWRAGPAARQQDVGPQGGQVCPNA